MIWRKMSIKKTWYLFLVGVPAEIISQMRGNQKVKMEDSYFGMLHNDPYSEYNYYGSQVYVPAASSGPSIVQFISAKVIDSAFFWSLYFYVSYRWRLLCLVDPKILRTLRWRLKVNKYFVVSHCAYAWQILSRFLVEPNKYWQSSAFGLCHATSPDSKGNFFLRTLRWRLLSHVIDTCG